MNLNSRNFRLILSMVMMALWLALAARTGFLGNWPIMGICLLMAVVNGVNLVRMVRAASASRLPLPPSN